jgi:hypothetical protein
MRTLYFEEQVLRKRPYLSEALCRLALAAPLMRATQDDGRLRIWSEVVDPRDGTIRVLRVIVLADGVTLHDAFFDRGYRRHGS